MEITVEQLALIVLLDNSDHVTAKTALMLAVALQRLASD
jgi:hypothetical protein